MIAASVSEFEAAVKPTAKADVSKHPKDVSQTTSAEARSNRDAGGLEYISLRKEPQRAFLPLAHLS